MTHYATCSSCGVEVKTVKSNRGRSPRFQVSEPTVGFTCKCGNEFRMQTKFCRTEANQMQSTVTAPAPNLSVLYELREIQRAEAERNTRDEYMVGLFNGIECSVATLESREPKYITTSGNLPHHGYTDTLTVKIGVDESTPEKVVNAFELKLIELFDDLTTWKQNLPAMPNSGCFPNDAGTMIFDYQHLYPRTYAVLSGEVELPQEPNYVIGVDFSKGESQTAVFPSVSTDTNVGKQVIVINNGQTYDCYETWVQENKPKDTQWLKYELPINGGKYTVACESVEGNRHPLEL